MFRTIAREELRRKMDSGEDFVLADVRSLDACKKEHLKGAICMPLDDIERQTAKHNLDKDRETIVYCSNTECNASPQAAEKLTKMGFSRVEDYKAGIKDWKEAGFPLEVCTAC